jgi:fatty-acyl-CoA synthase
MLSFSRGGSLPVLTLTIPQVLEESARRAGDREVLVVRHQGIRLSFAGLQRRVEATARGLWGLGIRPGDRVGMWSSNCAEWLYLQVATARIGAVLVNVNPAYRSHDLGYVLRRSRMKAIFLRAADARANYLQILEEAREAAGSELPLDHVVVLGGESWDEMIASGVEPPAIEANCEDVVNIQYTSGTTGSPKGVLLTHRNLVNNGYRIGDVLRLSGTDRICAPVPMYHCFGCVIGCMTALVHGVTLVLPAAQFDAAATLEAVEAERCTAIYGVPTMFIAELEHPEFPRFDMGSLRTGIMAGSSCPVELMKRVAREMHCGELTIAYGQTESSPVITMSLTTDDIDTRCSTVGAALPDTEVKIVDLESGETVPRGVQGELCTRGYLVMKGYDDDPEATSRAIDREGWLHTGDLATMREDGYYRITGRARDMINRGGENIYPREIEEFLHTHPKVADVYVVGIPHARLGETVLAWVKLRHGQAATEAEIKEYCKGKIAYFKVPEYVRFVDEFPMTVTHKVQKYRIQQQEIEERGLRHLLAVETA